MKVAKKMSCVWCSEEGVTKINTDIFLWDLFYPIDQIIRSSLKRDEHHSCHNTNLVCQCDEKIIIFSVSKPINLKLQKVFNLWGERVCLQISYKQKSVWRDCPGIFCVKSNVYTQEECAKMKAIKIGIERDVQLIAFYVRDPSNKMKTYNKFKISVFIYGTAALNFLVAKQL